ncbi:MAG: outer membrane beta-barrel protein [Lentisphaerae bacterium]|nr:outer membrane beta-barrel protein [Lentisphaerota bacterium]
MRKLSAAVIVTLVSVLFTCSAKAEGHRVGAGVNISSPNGVADDGTGGYISHMFDISDVLATYVGISHLSGDFALTDEGVEYKGSYTATQLEAALVAQWRTDYVTPYVGLGGGYNYLSFDNMDVGNKLALFYIFGLRVPVGESFGIESSARLSYLRPRSYNPQIETVDMEEWLIRLGAYWSF